LEEEPRRLEEESTTTYDILDQARGKKRKRNTKDRIYNWRRRLKDDKTDDLWMKPVFDDLWTDPGVCMEICGMNIGVTDSQEVAQADEFVSNTYELSGLASDDLCMKPNVNMGVTDSQEVTQAE
jgi:hypothetical protein